MASVLAILAVVCLALVGWRNRALAHEQQALQVGLNCRAGVEYYLATGSLPEHELSLGPNNGCRVRAAQNGNLVFEGRSGEIRRTLILVQGDPSRATEVAP